MKSAQRNSLFVVQLHDHKAVKAGLVQVSRGIIIKNFPWVVIDPFFKFAYFGGCCVGEIITFGVMAAYHFVLVFIGSTLVRAVWVSKV